MATIVYQLGVYCPFLLKTYWLVQSCFNQFEMFLVFTSGLKCFRLICLARLSSRLAISQKDILVRFRSYLKYSFHLSTESCGHPPPPPPTVPQHCSASGVVLRTVTVLRSVLGWGGLFLCGVGMFSLCLHGFPLVAPVSAPIRHMHPLSALKQMHWGSSGQMQRTNFVAHHSVYLKASSSSKNNLHLNG